MPIYLDNSSTTFPKPPAVAEAIARYLTDCGVNVSRGGYRAAYAAEDPTFRRICSTKTATVGGRSMTNHNKLLRQLEGCIGMKTGYTKAAGRTLVSCAERQGTRENETPCASSCRSGRMTALCSIDETSTWSPGWRKPLSRTLRLSVTFFVKQTHLQSGARKRAARRSRVEKTRSSAA